MNGSLFLFLAAFQAAPRLAAPRPITLQFEVRRDDAPRPALLVEVATRGGVSGRTRFKVPYQWAGQDSLRRSIVGLEVMPPARLLSDSGSTLIVEHAPNAQVTLRYRVEQDWTGPLRYPMYHRPVVDTTRVMINAANALLFPDLPESVAVDLNVEWRGVPANWTVLTSFGGSHSRSSTTIGNLGQASFVAGAFRVWRAPGKRNGFAIAVQDQWRFSDADFAGLMNKVWEEERRFWGDDGSGAGFITLSRIDSPGTQGGTAFTGGFVAFADSASTLTMIGRLAAHELLHLWNGQGMKSGAPEERYKWFSEGFTDYYAERFFHAAGGWSDSTWLAKVNQGVERYRFSPARTLTLAEVEARYWTDGEVNRFPYLQGYQFAMYLQEALPRATASSFNTDSLIRRVYAAARRSGAPVTDSLILAVLPAKVRRVMERAIETHIRQGAVIPVLAGGAGRCLTVVDSSIVPFTLGLDAARSTRERVVRGVEPGGPAALAGLVDGMPLAGWGWNNGDVTRQATFRIRDSTGVRAVSYLPRATQAVVVPQLRAGGASTSRPCGPRPVDRLGARGSG